MTADMCTVVSGTGCTPAATTFDSYDTGRRCDGTDGRSTADSPSLQAFETEEPSSCATKVTA